LIFAAVSIPSAVVVIGWFLAHRYDGLRLWNLQGVPGMVPMVWIGTAISFLFLYPATYNLLEIPAVLKPQVRLYATGIIRISRHPQAGRANPVVFHPCALDWQQFHAGDLRRTHCPPPIRGLAWGSPLEVALWRCL
jgi:hypothetical protein